ncbi:GDP-fucose protein O-fucosyltransferase 2-like isoform X2 [Babylonia areolata]
MRVANLVRNLNKEAPWILVLPPWGRLYHWKSRHLHQIGIPWSLFFDLPSLRRFVPVIEFEEFLKLLPEPVIDELYYLQNYAEGWTDFEDKMDVRDCIENPYRRGDESGLWEGWFFGYGDHVAARKVTCISLLGHSALLQPFLLHNTTARTVMVDRAETVLHDRFGDKWYWECRRSMRFSRALRDLGDEFRREFLDSTDEKDNTVLEDDWRKMERKHGEAKGGPYVAAHLRRADFLYARPEDVPSIENTAKQLKEVMDKQKVDTVFIASDAPKEEIDKLKELLKDYKVFRYEPSKDVMQTYKDGGVAIIDQWICAHAKYFIGTRESTFSFRIQDEREILGFDPDTTYNRICGDKDKECEQPARWTIVYNSIE